MTHYPVKPLTEYQQSGDVPTESPRHLPEKETCLPFYHQANRSQEIRHLLHSFLTRTTITNDYYCSGMKFKNWPKKDKVRAPTVASLLVGRSENV
jgi:hypothetical protein